MIELGIARAAAERREAATISYTDLQLLRITSHAAAVHVGATAAVETVAGLAARCFAQAHVDGDGGLLTPRILAIAGRALIARGAFVAVLDVAVDGRMTLLPGWNYDVDGGPDPASWFYRIDLSGPSLTTTAYRPRAAVLHAMIDPDTANPWRGRGALDRARASAELDSLAQKALAADSRTPVAAILPLPDGTDDPTVASLKADIEASAGRVLMPSTVAAGFGEGRNAAPMADWKQQRIGPQPPEALVMLADQAAMRIAAALGMPPSLSDSRAPGVSIREGRRQFQVDVLEPMATIVAAEASELLGRDVAIWWPERPDVITTRARTYSTLRRSPGDGQTGMDDAAARAAAEI